MFLSWLGELLDCSSIKGVVLFPLQKPTVQKDSILKIMLNIAGSDMRGKCGSYEGKTKV